MEIKGFLQTYAWGKVGQSSLVARLYGGDIDPATTYAELWMGTHPSGTSEVVANGKPLKTYIEENPHLLGKLQDYWESNENLPFLFKVLSVNKALSIQVHPDKDTAEMLNNRLPNVYRDPNYKPEMAIALSEFRALCGFRPIEEMNDICVNLPELKLLVEPDLLVSYRKTGDKHFLKKIINVLLTRSEESVNEAVQDLFSRLENADKDTKEKYRYTLIKKLHEEFPGDSGIFITFFLNIVHLTPGEAIYIPAGLPHAYLSGDCIECMACSDNVVRAGLTPKLKDIDTLLTILDYQSYTPEGIKLRPEMISPYTSRFNPPVPDFGVSRVIIPPQESWLSPVHDSCQILIVISGEGTCTGRCIQGIKPQTSDIPECNPEEASITKDRRDWNFKFGTTMFLPPYCQYKISSLAHLEIYFAYTNSQNVLPDYPLLTHLIN